MDVIQTILHIIYISIDMMLNLSLLEIAAAVWFYWKASLFGMVNWKVNCPCTAIL